MPKWSDVGGILATIREIDVGAVRDEAEQPIALICIGHERAAREVSRLLHQGPQRYALVGTTPLRTLSLSEATAQAAAIRQATLLILAIDATQALTEAEAQGFGQLDQLAVPYIVVVVGGSLSASSMALSPAALARMVTIANPAALDASDLLAVGVLERLPGELHLAAARALPGLRGVYSRELIAATSFTNATYALASGLPEQIPVFNIPFAAADLLVLTKNQAILVYRIALAYGAAPDFQARIREVVPVVGSAFLWRQAARSLIGLIPIWGLVPKIAIAYAGTYTTGVAAWRWFENGEMVSTDQVRRISQEAIAIGRIKAAELVERARSAGGHVVAQARTAGGKLTDQARVLGTEAQARARGAGSMLDQVRRRLPLRRK